MGDVARDADDKEEELHNMHQQFMQLQVGDITREDLYCPESLSYQKKDGHAWLHPSFFWYDTDFLDFFFFFFF